jgi:NADPH2:quinone reductase
MSTVARSDNATGAGLKPLEIDMRRIVHHELGEPARVLRVEDGPSPSLGPDQVRIRLSYAPIHPGDLLGVMGSPAFGTPPTIALGGRVPGFEGAGVVSEVGAKVDPTRGLKRNLRVAFFPASGTWSDEAVVPADSVAPLPDSIPDEVGAQMLINTVTALTVIRAAHDSLPPDARAGVVALLTGAGSAVGRLIGQVLNERGIKVIGLVRSEASAAKLTGLLPGSPVFATEVAGWKDRVRAAAEGAKIHVAIDSVGGRLLGDVADLLAERTGTVINFGSLGGETGDIRLFPPRALTLKGVMLGSWMQQPPEQRKADIALAQRLAHEPGTLFEVAERYAPSRIADAVAHVSQAGRAGVVLIDFSKD